MYWRVGKKLSFRKNLQLAYMLSTTAGIVNVASLIAFYVLTTNVTGHMAILTEEIAKGHWHQVQIVFIWLLLFFLGAFTSTILVVIIGHNKPQIFNSLAMYLEAVILIAVAIYGMDYYQGRLRETEILASALLFAMGLQNALVTNVSNYVVRTTHLTGLLTDLGIDVAMLFNKRIKNKTDLKRKLQLRGTILFFYFLGGLIGGFLFLKYEFKVFILAALLLVLSLYMDLFKILVYKLKKKIMGTSAKPLTAPIPNKQDSSIALSEKRKLEEH